MWKKFKKKVTNLIYEDVEEDSQDQLRSDGNDDQESRPEASHREERKRVQTRMTYEYPNEHAESFRFPVIPDGKTSGAQPLRSNRSKHRTSSASESSNQPAYVRRRKKSQRIMRNRHRNIHTRPIYEQKKLAEELENIPAFKRRRRSEMRGTDNDSKEVSKVFATINEVKQSQMSYSKPDELDAVFRRKNSSEQSDKIEHTPQQQLEESNPNKDEYLFSQVEKQVSTPTQSNRNEDELTKYEKAEPFVPEINSRDAEQFKLTEDRNLAYKNETDNGNDNAFDTSIPHDNNVENYTDYSTSSYQATNKLADESTIEDSKETIDLPYHLLDDVATEQADDREWLRQQKQMLQQTLEHFNVDAKIVAVTKGPTVTRIEIQPALGVKVSRIRNLADDIKLNLAARDVRIEAPIPGKHTVGIEIPNEFSQVVHLQEMFESKTFQETNSPLTVALGLTIEGEPYFTDINKMPHGLIAGATGSGKSVCINAMILSLLYKSHYEDVKLMMIDPKMVELTQYNGIPHLLTPVITDAKAATVALKWAVDEMERRYELFVEQQVRNIKRYNRKVTEEKLPYIVIIIDELADLMLVSPQEVEDYISRIAQKARAAGIHLILATQRPSVDVITGLIKANIPSRIAFAVSSQVDSRTILDANGAEKLLGKGDMLFVENGMNKQLRLQGPFVTDDEIDRVVHYLRSVAEPDYLFEHDELFLQLEHEEEDELFEEVVEFVLAEERASTSLLQRRFRIGYNRAARLIDSLYDRGIISGQNGSRPRDVLITKTQWEDSLNNH